MSESQTDVNEKGAFNAVQTQEHKFQGKIENQEIHKAETFLENTRESTEYPRLEYRKEGYKTETMFTQVVTRGNETSGK